MSTANCVLVFFKEIRLGDVRKHQAESSDSNTGGGARDLRAAPAAAFQQVLERMFRHPGPVGGVTQGLVQWTTGSGEQQNATVELWPPTDARDNELRLARFYEISGWGVDEQEYNQALTTGERWFYVLELHADNTVWARVLHQGNINREDPLVAKHLRERMAATPRNQSVRGAVDLVTGQMFP
jgi:hypothetical protein